MFATSTGGSGEGWGGGLYIYSQVCFALESVCCELDSTVGLFLFLVSAGSVISPLVYCSWDAALWQRDGLRSRPLFACSWPELLCQAGGSLVRLVVVGQVLLSSFVSLFSSGMLVVNMLRTFLVVYAA